jgi:signal peptidase
MKSLLRFIVNTIVFIALLVGIILGYNYYQKKQGKVAYFLGYTAFVVKGDSMLPVLKTGNMIILKKEKNYQKDDIVTFINNQKQVVTHRIIEETDKGYRTKGDNNKFEDTEIINNNVIYGKMIYNFKPYGQIVNFIVTYKWYLLAGFLGLCILGKLLF